MAEKTPKANKKLEKAPKGGISPFASLAPRRNNTRIAAGAMLMALSALAGIFIFQSIGERIEVYVAVRTVPAGQIIVADDVALKRISVEPGINYMGAGDKDKLIGAVPAAQLLSGSVINPKQIGSSDTPEVKPGQVLVGVQLDVGERPSQSELKLGDKIQLGGRGKNQGDDNFVFDATIASITQKKAATTSAAASAASSATASLIQFDVYVKEADAIEAGLLAKEKKLVLVKVLGGN